MDVERTTLPGIGLRHTFTSERGRQVAVISHRSGRRDLVVYGRNDPDTPTETLSLTREEANGLADLLGTSRVEERLAELGRQVEGLTSEQIAITAGSPFDGRTLGETQARSRTGASIVAVVRAGGVIASPRPDFLFHEGDIVVVVGTADGTTAVTEILNDG
nr:cation:proton antiporter regulatory subunit [Kibdelosporangium sp. MJ126-NF4]CEL17506.1 Potassium channel TrkA, possible KefG analog required for KefB activity [Kibdelosporangium sp. MJ126-NF4]CTQ91267.1 Potassium channel TrkA, possible KefG analog required for KefB activity [Kibdelosporangium sp. MJ126-NF4]